ncbi:hypothetical protein CPB84DRAFT_1835950 [Gymnopilus junonius]|uniref:SNF5-domain-containing protein n=1 Tax=Gymnopilus junonius TaxID=109634 RepID=A0A9P5TPE0_GYMJU|nr:hypothetical protein CPB84DRAFT_1835950 [Gymnopilus junonius]
MRQGSLPPQSTPNQRQGSLPPSGRAPNMNMMNMNMNLGNTPSSPAMPMAPSLSSTSSMGPSCRPRSELRQGACPPPDPVGWVPTPSPHSHPPGAPAHPLPTPTQLYPQHHHHRRCQRHRQHSPPLPPSLNLNPSTTAITLVPLLTSTQSIPPLSIDEIAQVKSWMDTDAAYAELLRGQQTRMVGEVKEAISVGGTAGPAWWDRGGNGVHGMNLNRWRRGRESFDVRYPRVKKEGERYGMHGGRSGRKGGRREGLKLPRKIDPEDANRPEQLVPIRIEFDVEHHKMRDTFVWNLNDPVVTPEAFAQSLMEDYALAPSYHSVIVKSIQDQLSDFRTHSLSTAEGEGAANGLLPSSSHDGDQSESAGLIKGTLDDESARWWELWRKRVRAEGGVVQALSVDEFKLDEKAMHEDMRILIRLDIIVGSVKLDDQFEWDLDNPTASPEDFAEVYTQELGLGGEFKTAIAHSIREQVQTYQKSLFLVGHPSDGTALQDDDLKQSFLPSLTSGARPVNDVQQFTPLLNYLSDGELERTEKERDKDLVKRRKRNTRGRRGVALPDREPIRTYRTPAIGFPELDAATLALAAAANAPMSRRAAAAAASLTIANMVASENGTTFMPQPIQVQPVVAQQLGGAGAGGGGGGGGGPGGEKGKEKKPKGLFKAPGYPSSVLRPRAGVLAPTPSTAADTSAMSIVQPDNEAPPSVSSPTIPSGTTSALGSLGGGGGGGAGAGGSGQDGKGRVITAKRAKELEREAKEREFVDGQHPNYIDGVWHCSNCGCPESIAVGRRKGPLGDKSQCGTCGKFWHRHRRPRPVEYNADPGFHTGIRQKEMEASKTPAKKKGTAAALRAQSTAAPSEPQTPARSYGDGGDGDRERERDSARKGGRDRDRDRDRSLSPPPPLEKEFSSSSARERERENRGKKEKQDEDDRALSPVSTASSASEPPLAQRVKMNGTAASSSASAGGGGGGFGSSANANANHTKPSASAAASATSIKAEPPTSNGGAGPSTSAAAPPSSSTATVGPTSGGAPSSPHKTWPPAWLSSALAAMQARYPNDKFEVILRKVNASSTPEWRIKCLDCPGKLYTPGPGETLSNYDVHLKNRQHRQRVNERLAAVAAAAASAEVVMVPPSHSRRCNVVSARCVFFFFLSWLFFFLTLILFFFFPFIVTRVVTSSHLHTFI